jgi:hypothetical protein
VASAATAWFSHHVELHLLPRNLQQPLGDLTNVSVSGNGISEAVAGNDPNCAGDITGGNNLQCVANLFHAERRRRGDHGLDLRQRGQIGINGNKVYDFTLSNSSVQGNGNAAARAGSSSRTARQLAAQQRDGEEQRRLAGRGRHHELRLRSRARSPSR